MNCHRIIDQISQEIINKLNNIIFPDNPVIVYDIDHTVIDGMGRPIHPIIRTYHHARDLGIQVVFITARVGTPENIKHTIEQLKWAGIHESLYMYFRPENEWDPHKFKLQSRKNIHCRGHVVIMSVGDMPWDIGEYGGFGYLLPQC